MRSRTGQTNWGIIKLTTISPYGVARLRKETSHAASTMKELRNKIFKIFEWVYGGNESYQYEGFDKVIQAIEDDKNASRKRGGDTTKKKYGSKHFSEAGKKGMAKRWKK